MDSITDSSYQQFDLSLIDFENCILILLYLQIV